MVFSSFRTCILSSIFFSFLTFFYYPSFIVPKLLTLSSRDINPIREAITGGLLQQMCIDYEDSLVQVCWFFFNNRPIDNFASSAYKQMLPSLKFSHCYGSHVINIKCLLCHGYRVSIRGYGYNIFLKWIRGFSWFCNSYINVSKSIQWKQIKKIQEGDSPGCLNKAIKECISIWYKMWTIILFNVEKKINMKLNKFDLSKKKSWENLPLYMRSIGQT